MSGPAIICVAITGSLPQKSNNPAVPVTVAEQIESTHEAFEAGASVAHCHVRNDDGSPSSDPERFAGCWRGCVPHCPGLIVQLSTGGRSGAGQERGGMLPLRPDMASLAVGSNNFPDAGLREQPRSGRLAGNRDAAPRSQAGDRGVRPEPHLPGRRDDRGRPTGRPAARAVRDGREERHARRSRSVRIHGPRHSD